MSEILLVTDNGTLITSNGQLNTDKTPNDNNVKFYFIQKKKSNTGLFGLYNASGSAIGPSTGAKESLLSPKVQEKINNMIFCRSSKNKDNQKCVANANTKDTENDKDLDGDDDDEDDTKPKSDAKNNKSDSYETKKDQEIPLDYVFLANNVNGVAIKNVKLDKCLKVEQKKITFSSCPILGEGGDQYVVKISPNPDKHDVEGLKNAIENEKHYKNLLRSIDHKEDMISDDGEGYIVKKKKNPVKSVKKFFKTNYGKLKTKLRRVKSPKDTEIELVEDDKEFNEDEVAEKPKGFRQKFVKVFKKNIEPLRKKTKIIEVPDESDSVETVYINDQDMVQNDRKQAQYSPVDYVDSVVQGRNKQHVQDLPVVPSNVIKHVGVPFQPEVQYMTPANNIPLVRPPLPVAGISTALDAANNLQPNMSNLEDLPFN